MTQPHPYNDAEAKPSLIAKSLEKSLEKKHDNQAALEPDEKSALSTKSTNKPLNEAIFSAEGELTNERGAQFINNNQAPRQHEEDALCAKSHTQALNEAIFSAEGELTNERGAQFINNNRAPRQHEEDALCAKSAHLKWLWEQQPKGFNFDLATLKEFIIEQCLIPEPQTEVLQVVGTNGKGSTSLILESLALQLPNKKIGVFTSPHLVHFNERIRINGKMISDTSLINALKQIHTWHDSWVQSGNRGLTFFELSFASALFCFKQSGCDILILEAGLGGRLDATSAIPVTIGAVTSIGLDHMDYLGDNLSSIASEKAAIARPPMRCLCIGINAQQPIVLQSIKDTVDGITPIALSKLSDLNQLTIDNLPAILKPQHQQENAALALLVAKKLEWKLNTNLIKKAWDALRLPARFQLVELPHQPEFTLIVDGSHNPQAIESLLNTWKLHYPKIKPTLILGFAEDKLIRDVIQILAPISSAIILTPLHSPRSWNPESYKSIILDVKEVKQNETQVSVVPTCKEAINLAYAIGSPTLLAGSLFLVGECLAIVENTKHLSSSQ